LPALRQGKMQRLLRRSVLVVGILLISATGLGDAAPRANEQPDVAVVPLLDPTAMPESAIPVARASINYIVIHYTDISYARTLRAFNNLESDVSAHYVIRGDGHIAQIVHEADTAWHSGNYWYNLESIGIELELDRVTNPAFTAEEYYAAAALVCAISARQGIPLD